MSKSTNFLKALIFLGLISFSTACTQDKLKSDCQKFDQGFLEACNKSCPAKCSEIAIASKKVNLPKEKIEQMCKESCTKHCVIQLEKVKPSQCVAKK